MRNMDIVFPYKTALQMVLSPTVTFSGTVSNIGGTLSLFCGFSILSTLEVLFWSTKLFAKRIQNGKGKNQMTGKQVNYDL